MSAVQIASQRLFRNFRSDVIIDTRQIGLALRKLRHWGRDGHPDELDLEASIEATGKNAGDIALVFRPERKNNLKLLLLMAFRERNYVHIPRVRQMSMKPVYPIGIG